MTCLTCILILRGGVQEVFALDSEVLLRRPLGLRPFPFEVTVLIFVCLVLGSMLEVISGVGFFAVSSLATLFTPSEKDFALASLLIQ
jgi:hypothetical protein